MNLLQISRPIESVFSQTIFKVAGFRINNSTLFIFIIAFFIIILSVYISRKFKLKPGNLQVIIEMIAESIENLLFQITGSKKKAAALFPYIGGLFVFVGMANILGLVPGLTEWTFGGKTLFRVATADFNTTFSLALAAILIIQLLSIKSLGIFGYLGRFFQFKEIYLGFKKGITDGLVAVIGFFVGLLDIVGEVAKVISLSLRLFGNIYAGIVLSVIAMGALAYLLPAVWLSLGLLFAVVQAIVFGSLIAAYYVLAVPEEQ